MLFLQSTRLGPVQTSGHPSRTAARHARALRLVTTAALLFASITLGPKAISQVVGTDGKVQPALLEENDLTADAGLAAEVTQGIVLRGRSSAGIGRFRVNAGPHTFCVSGGGRGISAFEVQSGNSRATVQALDRQGCVRATLGAGVVSLRLRRNTAPPVPWVTAVLRADPPPWPNAAPLLQANGSPAEGYWAIQDTTFNGRGTFGNRVLSWQLGDTPGLSVDPNTHFDGDSLLQLPTSTPGNQIPARLASTGDRWSLFVGNPYVTNPCDDYCGSAYGTSGSGPFSAPVGLTIQDLGNYNFLFFPNPSIGNWLYGEQSGDRIVLNTSLRSTLTDQFQVLFRFLPEGSTFMNGPRGGEVALFQGCGYTGNTAFFIPLLGPGVVSPGYDLSALSSSATTLDGTVSAVSVSPGHSVYWGSNASTPQGGVVQDTSCLQGPKPTGQLFVEPLANTLVVAHDLLNRSCTSCVMDNQNLVLTAGTDTANFSGWNFGGATFHHSVLTGLNLSGGTFTSSAFAGATLTDVDLSHLTPSGPLDFTGATLTRVKFAGTDITGFKFKGATLSQVDFSQSKEAAGTLDFTGATLNQVNLQGISSANLIMPQSKLCGVSLSGSDVFHRLDLTSGNFAGTQVALSSACAANLSFTVLNASVTEATSWSGLNLTGTVVNGLAGKVLSSQGAPLDLGGATLTGVSMQGAILDYATHLAGTDLTGADFSNASLRWTNLSNAKLYAATLSGANLERANMNSVFLTENPKGGGGAAHLEGAFLRGVNLSQAQLSGAIFTNANFYGEVAVGAGVCTPDSTTGFTDGCATASHATMDGTAFNAAYLFGVDFTSAKAQGVNFGNSYLVGTNFSGATLNASADGNDPGFAGAFLQGANLSGLTLNNITFRGAFVDFSPMGNIILTELPGQNTTFAGYWNQPAGQKVCAQMTYTSPTTPPTNNNGITCPDGSKPVGGCGVPAPDGSNPHWKSDVFFPSVASYLQPSTYYPAATPFCTADLKWIPLNIAEHPPQPHPRPRPGPAPWPKPQPRPKPKPRPKPVPKPKPKPGPRHP